MSNKAEQDLKAGYTHYVVAAYAYADKERGEVISRHKTYEGAQQKAKGSTMWGIKDIREYADK